MNDSMIAAEYREDFAGRLKTIDGSDGDTGRYFDIHVSSSGLQKAIRRGNRSLALLCAKQMLRWDPPRFWRRLVNIAFEDIGAANVDLVGSTVSVAGNSSWRVRHGGDETNALALVVELCDSVKDRSADDIIVLCEHLPRLSHERERWQTTLGPDIQKQAMATATIEQQCLAAWYLRGTSSYRSQHLGYRAGSISALLDWFERQGLDRRQVEVCRLGMARGGNILAAFLPLISRWSNRETIVNNKQEVEPVGRFLGTPTYVFDRYTQLGKLAIRRFISQNKVWRDFLDTWALPGTWENVTGDALFRVEGALLDQRRSSVGLDLILEESNQLVPGLTIAGAELALDLMNELLPAFDAIRLESLNEQYSHLR